MKPSKRSRLNCVLIRVSSLYKNTARLVRHFCAEHKSISQEIRDAPSRFNPIKEVLNGQGYQYLLNAG